MAVAPSTHQPVIALFYTDGPFQGLVHKYTLSQSMFLAHDSFRAGLAFTRWSDTAGLCLLVTHFEKLKA